jgi:hypothetical protein
MHLCMNVTLDFRSKVFINRAFHGAPSFHLVFLDISDIV